VDVLFHLLLVLPQFRLSAFFVILYQQYPLLPIYPLTGSLVSWHLSLPADPVVKGLTKLILNLLVAVEDGVKVLHGITPPTDYGRAFVSSNVLRPARVRLLVPRVSRLLPPSGHYL
jgi:hypothetical protein